MLGCAPAPPRSESILPASPEARVDDVVEHRTETVAKPETESCLVVRLKLATPQKDFLEVGTTLRQIELIVDELHPTADLDGQPLRDPKRDRPIELKAVALKIVQVLRCIDPHIHLSPGLSHFVTRAQDVLWKPLVRLVVNRGVSVPYVRGSNPVGYRELAPRRVSIRIEAPFDGSALAAS